jgi:epoxyqueuosine reductase
MRRVPRDILLRNVAIALGNTGSPDAIPALVALAANRNPLVRGHAVWALRRLGAPIALPDETDPLVLDELTAAAETPGSRPTSPPP